MNPEIYHPPADLAKSPNTLSRVVTWIVGLAIGGIVAAIIIPTTHRGGIAFRSIDASHLRQIGQASLIYASDKQDQLPQVDDIYAFARDLARLGGLNDATIWVSSQTRDGAEYATLSTVLTSDRRSLNPTFAATRPSIAAAVRGLKINHPATTPIAWTRGLQPDGTWSKDSPYGGDGGHIVFLGGNVSWFRDLKQPANALPRFDGQGTTTDIRAALPPDAVIANN
ncbi:MAG: prepilin-type cleavage/methylation domain-containing protein [Burkholderiales bacterium]|nr:prepilin-type cleavage/methylation domain-containing protein [Opitutaceae bacterium]